MILNAPEDYFKTNAKYLLKYHSFYNRHFMLINRTYLIKSFTVTNKAVF